MKLKISFLPEEAMKAQAIVSILQPVLGAKAKVKESHTHPPYRHLYILTKRPRVDSTEKM